MAQIANLFLIGAAKSGTSTLHDYLSLHPKISGSINKEPHFFCNPSESLKLSAYSALFNQSEEIKYRLDSSTGYLMFDYSIDEIIKNTKDPKFLVLLRNPIDRLISHYQWLYGYGYEKMNFWDAINNQGSIKPIYGNLEGVIGYKNYLAWGFYGEQLEQVFSKVGKNKVGVYFFEDFVNSPEKVLNDIYDFLNLVPPAFSNVSEIKSNQSINMKFKNIYNFVSSAKLGKLKRYTPKFINNFLSYLKKSTTHRLKTISLDKKPFEANKSDRERIKRIYIKDVETLSRVLGLAVTDLPWKDFNSRL